METWITGRLARAATWQLAVLVAGLLLLCSLSLPALAGSPSPDPMGATWITGRLADCGIANEGTDISSEDADASGFDALVTACTLTPSDPRVAGELTTIINARTWGRDEPIGYRWSSQVLKGPEGSWTGRGYSVVDRDGQSHSFNVLRGGGAYRGLTFVYSMTYGTTPPFDLTGLVYPGDPPADYPTGPLPVASPSA
jgi:hypothetical protein